MVIIASGPRCGSTLVQRLLCSHPKVLIWGEHGGALRSWPDAGFDGFIANLMPPLSGLRQEARSLLLRLWADPAVELGRPLWGFKEIRYGRGECVGLLSLFPEPRFVHLTRDPRHVLVSLDWWERSST